MLGGPTRVTPYARGDPWFSSNLLQKKKWEFKCVWCPPTVEAPANQAGRENPETLCNYILSLFISVPNLSTGTYAAPLAPRFLSSLPRKREKRSYGDLIDETEH